jgi:hypothetical protein
VLSISTKIETPCPSYHVLVHNSSKRDANTGLYSPCVVKYNWAAEIEQSDVIRSLGYIPSELMERIVAAYDALYDDPLFDDWI